MVTGIREIIITDWPRRSLQEVLERHCQKPLEDIKYEETKEASLWETTRSRRVVAP